VILGLFSDLRTLVHASFAPVRGATHAERLEEYYRDQADSFDAFRPKLLHGRPELLRALTIPDKAYLIDLGGGTGSNIEALGERRERCRKIDIVDLCPSLLRVAEGRVKRLNWRNVRAVLTPLAIPVKVTRSTAPREARRRKATRFINLPGRNTPRTLFQNIMRREEQPSRRKPSSLPSPSGPFACDGRPGALLRYDRRAGRGHKSGPIR